MTNINRTLLAAASALSMTALAACGDSGTDEAAAPAGEPATEGDMAAADPMAGDMAMDDTAMEPGAMGEPTMTTYMVGDAEFQAPALEPTPALTEMRAAELTPEQTERREGIDIEQVQTEAETAATEIQQAGEPLIDPVVDGPGSFAQLDRSGDQQLSVAEFAIFDLANINPSMAAGADQARPYVSTEALNMAADDFVRVDADGNNMLSLEEFTGLTG